MSGVLGQKKMLNRDPCARDRVWQSMRILRSFTMPELVATADAGYDNVRKYLRGLVSAGIVRKVRKHVGMKCGHGKYFLVRDLGPHAPRLCADGRTYDPNTSQFLQGGLAQRRPS